MKRPVIRNNDHQGHRLPQAGLFAAVLVLLVSGFLVGVCVGQFPITLAQIWAILTGGEVEELTWRVFWQLRLPRACMGVMSGAALGISGCVYQTIFKNALASPDIVGVAPGASLGAAVAIVMVGSSTVAISLGAFAGGIAVVFLVLLLVRMTPSNNTATYVLAGIVMSHISKAFIMLMKYYADPMNELAAIEFWTMGSLASITADKVLAILPLYVAALVVLLLLRRQVGLMSLNEDESRMLGVRLGRIRTVILIASTLLVASVISITGLITFIGLVAPHIAKMMLKTNNTATIIMSGMVGGTIVVIADTLARSIYSSEIPISILTTFLGIPVLVYFLCRRKELDA